jgi:hypothetical protein
MADSDEKLDRVLEHIAEIREVLAEMKGTRIAERLEKLEAADHENDRKWARLAGISTLAGMLGGGFLGALLKKAGLTP